MFFIFLSSYITSRYKYTNKTVICHAKSLVFENWPRFWIIYFKYSPYILYIKIYQTFRHESWFIFYWIRYFLVISIPAETPFFSFIDHVIWRKLQASLLPVWVATPDVNVNTTSFTVKMERPIKLYKDWCCVPQCKSDGRKRGK
jgi:hypothetical protein